MGKQFLFNPRNDAADGVVAFFDQDMLQALRAKRSVMGIDCVGQAVCVEQQEAAWAISIERWV